LALGDWREVSANTTINRAGDDIGGVWGIAAGQIDLTSALGAEDSPIADIQMPGSWGGIGPLFGRQRGANATAPVPSLIFVVPQARLNRLLAEHPVWWRSMGELAADLAFRYAGGLGDMLIGNAQKRCIAILTRLADCRREDPILGLPVSIACSQERFASIANMSGSAVGEVLRELRRRKLIDLGYRTITIIDAGGLRRLI
jgi:CRP-like cAMP-binding protein